MSAVFAQVKLPREPSEEAQYFWVREKVEVMVFRHEGELCVYASICPHMGAQLFYDGKRKSIQCPWHPLEANPKTGCSNHHQFSKFKRFNARLEKDELTIFESRFEQ